MEWHDILVFLHILCLVFWLGTDVAVFVLSKFALHPEYSTEQRLLLMDVALHLDIFPRVCVVLIVPTGLQLASNIELIPSPPWFDPWVWAVSALWMAVVLAATAFPDRPMMSEMLRQAERFIHLTLVVAFGGAAAYSFIYPDLIAERWLAVKFLAYALISLAMILLEHAFLPAVRGFQELISTGSTAEVEEKIRDSMDHTSTWVMVIYGAVLLSAFLGVAKP